MRFIALLDYQHLNTSVGRDTILTFLEERTYRTRKSDLDFNLYHPRARPSYFRILNFLQSNWLVDFENSFGRRSENLCRDFNHSLSLISKAKEELIDAYQPSGNRLNSDSIGGAV